MTPQSKKFSLILAVTLTFLILLRGVPWHVESRKLTWDGDYALSYKVYELIGGRQVLRGQTTSRSFPVPDSGTHTYFVTAVSGNRESSPSAPLTVPAKKNE